MRRYSELAWSGSHGWVRTVLIVLVLLLLGPMAFGIAFALFEGTMDVVGADPGAVSWAFRAVTGTGLYLGTLASLAFTQRAFRRRPLRSYLTAADRLRRTRLWEGGAAGAAIAGGGIVLGSLLGVVQWTGDFASQGWILAIVLALTPLHVAIEEVVRGVVLQTVLGRTKRGWAGIVGSSLVMALAVRIVAGWFEPSLSGWAVFAVAFGGSLLAATVALLDDGLELVMGARTGIRLVLFLGLGLLPIQVAAPFSTGLILVVCAAGAVVGGLWWTGGTLYDLDRVLKRVDPPSDRSRDPEDPSVDRCLNCGADLVGPYCHECGQKGVDRNQSLQVLLPEVTDVIFEVDSRIWRTIRMLLLRPGLLTRYYNGGRREEFVRPFRLYIAFSFLFFVALVSFPPGSPNGPFSAWSDAFGEFEDGFSDARTAIEVRGPVTDVGVADSTITVEGIRFTVVPETDFDDVSSLDSLSTGAILHIEGNRRNGTLVVRDLHLDDPDDPLKLVGTVEFVGEQSLSVLGTTLRATADTRFSGADSLAAFQVGDRVEVDYERSDDALTATSIESADNFVDRIMAGETDALKALIENFSRAMFFLVPLFGLLLQALYIRDPYLAHLIFALHEHAFIFFTGMLVVLVGLIPQSWTWMVQIVLGAGIPVYLALSLRTAYDESWLGAAAKGLFVLATYVILLIVGIVSTVGVLTAQG